MSVNLKSLLLFGAVCGAGVGVSGDLRAASRPKQNFNTINPGGSVQFVSKSVIYMEPSDFNYNGLKQQRNGGAYDNFLRSNIDNEQDKRNFAAEAGKDMLPFRSYETAANDASNTVQNKIPDGAPGPTITATPGVPQLYPLRWNNPHASELEVNVWIMKVPNGPIVVPIRKPTCSGEGHQDNVISFTIPANFNSLGETIPGFTGCKAEGDCVLQVYAHSVEPRTYSIGVPIIVTGDVPAATATSPAAIQPVQQDVGMNLAALPRDICLPSVDPAADIPVAVPRKARLVSDVFNHAYQNSDYSPYSGQQPEAISRNLQASAIISMIPANQGELGKSILANGVAGKLQNVRNNVQNLVKKYEGLTNKIIAQIGDKVMKNTATEGANGVQRLANCFRCAEVGSTVANRLTTNTYVPSFQLPADQIAAAKAIVPNQYKGLISDTGLVQIYRAVLNDMSKAFTTLEAQTGVKYQPAVIKASTATMADPVQFKKVNQDQGRAGARAAQATKQAAANAVSQDINVANTPLMSSLSADEDVDLPDIGTSAAVGMVDYDGWNRDTACDLDESIPADKCPPGEPLFAAAAAGSDDGSGLVILNQPDTTSTTGSTGSTISTGVIVGIAAGAGVLILLITGACVKYHRNKRNTVTSTSTSTTTKV